MNKVLVGTYRQGQGAEFVAHVAEIASHWIEFAVVKHPEFSDAMCIVVEQKARNRLPFLLVQYVEQDWDQFTPPAERVTL